MGEGIKLIGTYRFEKIKNGVVIEAQEYHNTVMTALKESILKFMNCAEEDPAPTCSIIDVQYIATGDDDTAVTVGDVALGNERFRKIYTQKSRSGNAFTAIAVLAADESNFTIKEVGIFAGGSATADSGTLLSRALVNVEKNSNIEINIYYRLELV